MDGTWHRAPTTFRTKREADAHLASVRVDMERGTWIDPDAGKVTFAAYADRWLSERPELRPRTRELYEGQLRLHINPVLGDLEPAQITPSRIRTWRAEMIAAGMPGPSTKDRPWVTLRDAPAGERPVTLRWRKRVWQCCEVLCPVTTWTEQRPEFVLPRHSLTERVGRWAADRVARIEATPTSLARQLGVTWPTVWAAIGQLVDLAALFLGEVHLRAR